MKRLLFALLAMSLPAATYAQEATLSGTVTDSTGSVLPGVTVEAVHEAAGNTFTGVTDGRGAYQVPVHVGSYRVTVQLPGFTTVTRSGVEVLVGQTAVINLQMSPSNLAETITVTGESPLVDTTTSSVGGNVDPRMITQLPSQGRNWMSLALLAPGNRTNAQGATPVQDRGDVREFQLNVDGLQVTSNLGTGNQARYSNDSIAEFEFISNRFDATQGRSSGVQVNAITKSGTNILSGSLVGNFRSSDWNAKDPVLDRVLPYSNQQISGTVGGPIMVNKLHFFGNYEYEHQPLTSIWQTPYPTFNVELEGTRSVKLGGVRGDYELSSSTRLMGKFSQTVLFEPFGPGTSNHPSGTNSNEEKSTDVIGQFTQVLSNRALNEFRAGYAAYGIEQVSLTEWSRHWQAPNGISTDGPNITLRGFQTGRNNNLPRYRDQSVFTVRDNFTMFFDAAGRHDVKMGGEYLRLLDETRNCNRCGGVITANLGPVPGNIEQILPDAFNADTWNLAALSNLTSNYQVGVSDESTFLTPLYMWKYGGWFQDDWRIGSRLTVNLGLRYDLIWNAFAQNVEFPPFAMPDRPQDANNFQPRFGFAYQLVRPDGGPGRFRAVLQRHPEHERPVAPESADDRRHSSQQRWTPRLRHQSVQRAAADLRAGAPTILLREQHAGLPAARFPGAGADSRVRSRDAQLADIDRCAASVRRARGAGRQLREHPEPRREIDPGQRQYHVRSCDRQSVSLLERGTPRVPDVRRRRDDSSHWPVGLPRTANELHQTHERQLAGVADVYAGWTLGSGPAAD